MKHQTRVLLLGAVGALVLLVLLGGGALAAAEGIGYPEGVWLAFTVVSTTGFGEGPSTAAGALLTMLLFALAAVQWFAILVAAFEIMLARSSGSHVFGYSPQRPARGDGTSQRETSEAKVSWMAPLMPRKPRR